MTGSAGGAPAVDEGPRPRASTRSAPAPMHSRAMPSWPSSTPACELHGGQRRAPGAPEGAEGGEPAQHAHPPGHPFRLPTASAAGRLRRALTAPRVRVDPAYHGVRLLPASIDGIPGESFDYKHKGEIDVQSFSWGETQQLAAGAGRRIRRGQGRDDRICTSPRTSRRPARSSCWPARRAQHIKSAVLTGRKAGKAQPEFLTFSLSDVLVSGYQTGGSSAEPPLDSISLSFAKIEIAVPASRRPTAALAAPIQGRLGPQDQQDVLSAPAGHGRRTTRSRIRGIRSPRRIPTASRRWRPSSACARAAPERCRVLELGCGDAGNLVPMALALPGASFVGIDAAPRGDRARARAGRALGLENVTLETTAIEDFAPPAGGFDYVIAHGVYSWVRAARCAIACSPSAASALRPRPAWPTSATTRCPADACARRCATCSSSTPPSSTDPRERIEQARALLRFLLEGWPAEHELGALMRGQAERLLDAPTRALLHDELAEVNDAVYFHEFAAHAARARAAVPRRGRLLRDADRRGPEPAARRPARDRGPGAPRAVPRLPQGRGCSARRCCAAPRRRRPHAAARVLEGLAVRPRTRARRRPRHGGVLRRPDGLDAHDRPPAWSPRSQRARRAPGPRRVWVRDLSPMATASARLRRAAARLRRQPRRSCTSHPPRLPTHAGERPQASPLARHQAARGRRRHQPPPRQRPRSRTSSAGGSSRCSTAPATGPRSPPSCAASWPRTARPVPDDLADSLERSLQGLARLALLEMP